MSPHGVALAAGWPGGVPIPQEWGWEQGDEEENHPGEGKTLVGSAGATNIPEDTTENGLRPGEIKDWGLGFAGCSPPHST